MPFISVDMFPGRSEDVKKALVRDITEAFVRNCGVPAESVWVVLREVPREHWGVGGKLRSE